MVSAFEIVVMAEEFGELPAGARRLLRDITGDKLWPETVSHADIVAADEWLARMQMADAAVDVAEAREMLTPWLASAERISG